MAEIGLGIAPCADEMMPSTWLACRWTVAAQTYAVLVALGLGYFIAGSPLQVSDCLRNMLAVQRTGFWELVGHQSTASGFLRPLLWAQIDIAFELANGRYFEMFKTIHVVQVVLAAVLFVNLLRVRTAAGALAVPFGIAMLFGAHTFAGTVVEAFPINTFLTIVICCLAAANLSQGAPAAWRDLAAVLLFVFAALTVETGLLVWIGLVTSYVVGFRGVSWRALSGTTVLLGAYMMLRFGPLNVGAPALIERSSGYGFRVLDPPELIARFGEHPIWFYAYNVVCQVLTVLFGEPRAGVWALTRAVTNGDVWPRDIIPVVASTGATILIAWYVISRLPGWRREGFSSQDRWCVVFVAMLLANAAISYPYTKNVIASPAGAFHALAASIAFGDLLARIGRTGSLRVETLAACLALALLSAAWSVRLVGIHYALREKAFVARNDWTEVAVGRPPADFDAARDPEGAALVRQLYDQALTMRVVNPAFASPYAWRYFEQPW